MWTLLLSCLVLPFVLPSVSTPVTLKDDAYHFHKSTHDIWYVEWWYFNFACPNGISAIYVIGVWNPTDEIDLGMSIVYALHFKGDTVDHTSNLRKTSEFSASYEQADVTIAKTNTIRVHDDENYSVIGSSADETVDWNLNFTGIVKPWFFYDNSSVGPSWQRLSWLVYMPRAVASGYVAFDGDIYPVSECHAYHDHDWGRWDAFAITWAWLQYSNEDITLVAGAGREEGYSAANNLWLKIDSQDLFLKFPPKECTVKYTDFVDSEIPGHKYPKNAHYVAQNDEYKLDLKYTVQASPGIWKSAVVVFEQKSVFTAVLTDHTGKIVAQWEGFGFTEWTDLQT